jgi:pimeloyl-ACP methyl ester carboxylesterase
MQTFDYNGIKISYLRRGSGKPMVLLHGFGASTYSWRYIIEALGKDHEVFAIDLKGFGLSDKPCDDRYSVKDQSDMVMAFIAHHHLKDVTVFGHSFGGGVALFSCLEGARSGENPISRMVLLDSASLPQEFPYFISMLRTPVLDRISLSLVPDRVNVRMLLNEAFHDGSKITEEMVEVYSGYLDLPGAHHSLIATARQIVPSEMETVIRRYREISVPVLLVWGEEDDVIPLSVGQTLLTVIPGARLQTIKNCGHVPQEECPEETIRIIKEFLGSPVGAEETGI